MIPIEGYKDYIPDKQYGIYTEINLLKERLSKVEYILHDFDDTVAHTYSSVYTLLSKFAEDRTLNSPDLNIFREVWGNTIPILLTSLFPGQDSTSLVSDYYQWVPSGWAPDPMWGVEDTFLQLQRDGYRLMIISSSRFEYIYPGKNSYFQFLLDTHHPPIYSSEFTTYHKPDPRVFDKPLAMLGRPPLEQILYIGDSVVDMQAANLSGINFIAATTGLTSRQDFMEEGVHSSMILDSFNDLPRYLGDICSTEVESLRRIQLNLRLFPKS